MTSIGDAGFAVFRRFGFIKHRLLTAASAAAILTTAGVDPAHAQSAPQPAQTNQTAQSPQVDEIIVTGSLIVRNGYQAPTPVTVVGIEEIQQQNAINFADFAQKVPTLSQSYSSRSGAMNSTDGNPGTSSLSLRGLGANRTLVLLDGVRITANNTSGVNANGGAVDINNFPDALIQRMDVVTGGATATYGSGALAGVVNMILDTGFTGLKGSATAGVTTYGDDRQYGLSLTGGFNFTGGRGHVVISGEHHYQEGILNGKKARPWIADDVYRLTNPAYTATNGQPFYLIVPHAQGAFYTNGGLINGGPLKGIAFGPGGVPHQFVYGSPIDGLGMSGGEDGGSSGSLNTGFSTDASIDIPMTRQNLFSRVSYDLTDDTQVYLQYDWAYAHTMANARGNYLTITIQNGNPFIPASVQAQMTALKLASFPLGFYDDGLGIIGSNAIRHFTMFLGGVKGKFDAFDSNWSWNVWATQSTNRTSVLAHNVFDRAKLTLATDAVTGSNGSIICRSTLANPTNGCVAFNPFGGQVSQAAVDYLEGTGPNWRDKMSLFVRLVQGAGVVRGEPFSTWAGPVSVAVGGEWNRNSSAGIADPLGITGGYASGNYNPTNGHYETLEGFAEVAIPLAKDVVWARSFDLTGGIRITDFSTSGTVATWKVGATYTPVDDLRFRATLSHDTRAPNLGELFAGGVYINGFVNNPFNGNKSTTVASITTGNASLAPEEANTTGIGVVYQSSLFPGFSASLDYFKIHIGPSITTAGTQATVDNCFKGITEFCANFDQNNLFNIFLRPVNAAQAQQAGYDIEASYIVHLDDINNGWNGSVTLRALASHVTSSFSTSADGTRNVGNRPWRYQMSATYNSDLLSVGWTGRGWNASKYNANYIECTSGCPTSVSPNFTINNNRVPGEFYMDLTFTYHLKPENFSSDLFLTIDNIANKHPDPIVLGSETGFNPLGRAFRAGVRFKM